MDLAGKGVRLLDDTREQREIILATLPHPISNLKPQQMRELTLHYVDQVVQQLTA